MHPHLSKVIAWYDILRYYNPMWYPVRYDELDDRVYEREETTEEEYEMLQYENESNNLSEFSD